MCDLICDVIIAFLKLR